MNHKFEVREDKNYGSVLFKDGRETFCPFQQPVPTQGMGGMGLMRLPCSTNCPLANLESEKQEVYDIGNSTSSIQQNVLEKIYYTTSCGGSQKKHELYTAVNNMQIV